MSVETLSVRAKAPPPTSRILKTCVRFVCAFASPKNFVRISHTLPVRKVRSHGDFVFQQSSPHPERDAPFRDQLETSYWLMHDAKASRKLNQLFRFDLFRSVWSRRRNAFRQEAAKTRAKTSHFIRFLPPRSTWVCLRKCSGEFRAVLQLCSLLTNRNTMMGGCLGRRILLLPPSLYLIL